MAGKKKAAAKAAAAENKQLALIAFAVWAAALLIGFIASKVTAD